MEIIRDHVISNSCVNYPRITNENVWLSSSEIQSHGNNWDLSDNRHFIDLKMPEMHDISSGQQLCILVWNCFCILRLYTMYCPTSNINYFSFRHYAYCDLLANIPLTKKKTKKKRRLLTCAYKIQINKVAKKSKSARRQKSRRAGENLRCVAEVAKPDEG